MSEASRHRIFSKLHAAIRQTTAPVSQPPGLPIKTYSQKERIERLKTLMEAMRTEVHLTGTKNWVNTAKDILKKREDSYKDKLKGTEIKGSLSRS